MDPRKFALGGGLAMIAVGAVALILPGSSWSLPQLNIENSYGLFLGLFPMNLVNKIVLLVLGVAGVLAASAKFTSLPMSILYSRFVFIAMGILTIAGFFSQTSTLYGYWPLYGNEIWLHGVLAILGAYYGFALTGKVPKIADPGNEYRTPLHGTR